MFKFNKKNTGGVDLFSFAAIILAGFAGGNYLFENRNQISQFAKASYKTTVPAIVNCNIKGNVSYNTSERIYHVPGQEYYNETKISPHRGERWFCSEQDARAAGWRKSKI